MNQDFAVPSAKINRRYGTRRFVKQGTLSGDLMWVRSLNKNGKSALAIGDRIEARSYRGYGDKWIGPFRIWKIGPSPEFRLFLEWI